MKYRLSLKEAIIAIAIGVSIIIPVILICPSYNPRTQLIHDIITGDPIKGPLCLASIILLTIIISLIAFFWNNSKTNK